MKKLKIYLLTSIFIISTVLPLTSCAQKSNENTTNSVSNISQNATTSTIEDKQYSNTSSNNSNNEVTNKNDSKENISSANSSIEEKQGKLNSNIPYPIFNNIDNKDKVNNLILNYVKKIEDFYADEDDMTIDINYEVMFKNNKYISIYFSGDVKSAAYPRKFKSTLNIDIEKASAIRLNEITAINDKFINAFSKGIEDEFRKLDIEVLDNYKRENLNDLLEQADDNGNYLSDVQSYFTDNEIVVIFSVVHALGDYMEIHIPKSSL